VAWAPLALEARAGYSGRMKLEAGNARAILWSTIAEVPLGGGAEQGRLREVDSGAARLRIVEYAPGFRADHWCAEVGARVFIVD